MDLMLLMVDHQFTRVVSVSVHTWYMGTNCAPLLADLFLHAHEADFLHGILKNKDKKLAKTFNSIFRYIDDALSLNNSRIGDYLQSIYSYQFEAQDTTDSQKYASYLDLHLEIDNENSTTNVTFTFQIVNFPFINRNIPASPVYGGYISQLIHYSRACNNVSRFCRQSSIC